MTEKKDKRNRLRKMALLLAGVFVIAALMFAFHPVTAKADFGDFSGDTDFGGGDSGGDWDSSWGSDNNNDNDNSYYSDSGSSSYSDSDGFSTVFAIIIAAIIIIGALKGNNRGNRRSSGSKPAGAAVTPDSMLQPMNSYKSLDPAFDEAAFREHMSNLYVQMQQEWHNKNIESLKPYMTDAFWNQMDRQLDEKRKAGQTPCTERVAVLETTPRGFYQSAGMDHIVVRVKARIVAYVLDDNTGNVISGDRNREKFMEYEWDVCRKSGVVSGEAGMQAVSCPHCGAPLNINQTARCPFCDSVVTIVNEDWALNSIKGVSQTTS